MLTEAKINDLRKTWNERASRTDRVLNTYSCRVPGFFRFALFVTRVEAYRSRGTRFSAHVSRVEIALQVLEVAA